MKSFINRLTKGEVAYFARQNLIEECQEFDVIRRENNRIYIVVEENNQNRVYVASDFAMTNDRKGLNANARWIEFMRETFGEEYEYALENRKAKQNNCYEA